MKSSCLMTSWKNLAKHATGPNKSYSQVNEPDLFSESKSFQYESVSSYILTLLLLLNDGSYDNEYDIW